MENENNAFERASPRVMPEDVATAIGANNRGGEGHRNKGFPWTRKFMEIILRIVKCIFERSNLRWFVYLSNVLALAYIGFSFFLLYEYKDSDHLGSFVFQSIIAVSLGVNYGVLTYLISRLDEKCFIVVYLFTFSVILSFLSLSMLMLPDYSHFDNIAHFIIMFVLLGATLNVFCLLAAIGCIMLCISVILIIFELPLLFCLLCPKRGPKVGVGYSIFYYDKNKTKVTECIVCLQDYKDGELICRGKCHVYHIAHEKCMLSWLGAKRTCPNCEKPIELC